ncbi:MAG: S1C family serine protease, partial [Lachnospiraceae bacterium]|nr:S1C family serine protease [Lachnospiraceae bacterium]
MPEQNNHEKEQELNNKAREEARLHRQEEDKIVSSTLADTDFLKEKIKERPINKKRLLRRTLMTVGLAVIFGLVACITFALLQPLLSGKLTRTEEVKVSPVLFPEETSELNPQDMVADEYQLQIIRREATETGTEESVEEGNEGAENSGENGGGEGGGTQQGEVTEHTGNASGEGEPDPTEETEETVELTAMEAASLELMDYRNAYSSLRKLTDEFSKSLVTVTALSEDGSWINMSLRNSDQTSGLILAENGRDLLILVKYDDIKRAAKLIVTFNNGKELPAQIVQADMVTGYAILAVELAELDSVTASRIAFPALGSSVGNSLIGQPVIAVGAPNGVYGSVYYGTITSQNEAMGLTDSDYRLIRTDIYG